jgi:voltage-gated potassium channel
MNKYHKIKSAIAAALDDEKNTRIDRIVDWIIISLIIISTIEIFLSTFSSVNEKISGVLNFIDLFTTIVFTIEVTLRILLAGEINPEYKGFKGRLKYCCSFYGLIDIIATYPFYLGFFFPIPYAVFKVFRIARLLRIFRYMTSFKLLKTAFMSKRAELAVSLQFLCIITLILSFVLFFVENKEQPEVYNNGWRAVVWAFNQYIKDPGGFGNTPPISTIGKLIACIIGILKIAIFAVPAGLIGSGFLQAVNAEKERESLKVLSDKLHLAFERKLDVFTGFYLSPMSLPLGNVQASQGLAETDIFKAVDIADDFRIVNLAVTRPIDTISPDKLAIEHFTLNREYGCFINRDSRVTIVAPSSSMDPGIGYYAYYLAKMGGFNLVSRELGVSRPYRSFYNQTYKGEVPGLEEFMTDINTVTSRDDSWVITLLPASGANEPEFPTQIHLEYGGAKGDPTFNAPDLLVKDIDLADKLFKDIETTFKEGYGLLTDRQMYHNTNSPDLYVRKLENANINSFVLRIAWSVFLWNSRKIEIAKTLADVINRNIESPISPVHDELKERGIGFEDYKE